MIEQDWFAREELDSNAARAGSHVSSLIETSINGWQVAGVFLLFFLLSPAAVGLSGLAVSNSESDREECLS